MSTFKQITEIIADISGIEEISISDNLQKDIGMDSLSLVTLLIELEQKFEIELDESDMNPFDLVTVFDVTELIEKCLEVSDEKES